MNRQLLCTFSDSKTYTLTIENIKSFYELIDNKIFVFSNVKNLREVYLTYNVNKKDDNTTKFANTISVHRKKETNTLYTLNAMNKIIEEENGSFDKNYKLNWKLYKNTIILTGEHGLRIIDLKLFSIVTI